MTGGEEEITRTPFEMIGDFYEKQNNQPMSQKQTDLVQELIESIWEENL